MKLDSHHANMSVSTGTMREEDLIPALYTLAAFSLGLIIEMRVETVAASKKEACPAPTTGILTASRIEAAQYRNCRQFSRLHRAELTLAWTNMSMVE